MFVNEACVWWYKCTRSRLSSTTFAILFETNLKLLPLISLLYLEFWYGSCWFSHCSDFIVENACSTNIIWMECGPFTSNECWSDWISLSKPLSTSKEELRWMRVWATQVYLSFFIQSADLSWSKKWNTYFSSTLSLSVWNIKIRDDFFVWKIARQILCECSLK